MMPWILVFAMAIAGLFILPRATQAIEHREPGYRELSDEEVATWSTIVSDGELVGYAGPTDKRGDREWALACGRVMGVTRISSEELTERAVLATRIECPCWRPAWSGMALSLDEEPSWIVCSATDEEIARAIK
jgi:hypothetical protein